jgi:hypothetical protein
MHAPGTLGSKVKSGVGKLEVGGTAVLRKLSTMYVHRSAASLRLNYESVYEYAPLN